MSYASSQPASTPILLTSQFPRLTQEGLVNTCVPLCGHSQKGRVTGRGRCFHDLPASSDGLAPCDLRDLAVFQKKSMPSNAAAYK